MITDFNVDEDRIELVIDTNDPELSVTLAASGLLQVACDDELLAEVAATGPLTLEHIIVTQATVQQQGFSNGMESLIRAHLHLQTPPRALLDDIPACAITF